MSKIQCNDYTCKFQKSNGYCTLKSVQLKDKVCQTTRRTSFPIMDLCSRNWLTVILSTPRSLPMT